MKRGLPTYFKEQRYAACADPSVTTASMQPGSAGGPHNASIFLWLFAISSAWHYTSVSDSIVRYWVHYNPLVTPIIFVSLTTALIAAASPGRIGTLMLFAVAELVTIGLRFPFVPDHRVMELMLSIAIILSYCHLAWKRKSAGFDTVELFELYSPVGRWLLIIMYFYGTFHKINAGFLNPESSCAIPFLNGFPLPASLLAEPWMQYAAIYGTLITEFSAMLMLFSARTKYYGMLLGMSFHLLIGISSYGTLAHFSAFALALHALFLPSNFGKRVFADPLVPAFLKDARTFSMLSILFVVAQVLLALHLAATHRGYLVNSFFGLFAVTLLWLVFRHGKMAPEDAGYRLKSSFALANGIAVWFFLHCLSPYVGLSTGGTIAMFSGLRTEGDVSNHYFVTRPIHLFPYQDKIVYIEQSENPSLREAMQAGQGVLLFDFERHFTTREALILPLKVRIGAVHYLVDDRPSLIKLMNENFTEQSWLARHYLSFRLVDDPHPRHCRH